MKGLLKIRDDAEEHVFDFWGCVFDHEDFLKAKTAFVMFTPRIKSDMDWFDGQKNGLGCRIEVGNIEIVMKNSTIKKVEMMDRKESIFTCSIIFGKDFIC